MKQDHNTLTALFEKPKTVSLTSLITKTLLDLMLCLYFR